MEKEFVEIFNLYKNDVYRLAYSYTSNKLGVNVLIYSNDWSMIV